MRNENRWVSNAGALARQARYCGRAARAIPALGFVLDASPNDVTLYRGMTTAPPSAPQKINLRRPDIMAAVQAQVLSHYRSDLVERIRANGHILSAGDLTIKLAKEFGFCYGVERAIDLAYAARRAYPERRIFLLGEIIHNPEVNDQIRRLGIVTIAGKPGDEEINQLRPEDIVIIPAFGTADTVVPVGFDDLITHAGSHFTQLPLLVGCGLIKGADPEVNSGTAHCGAPSNLPA